MQIVLVGNRVVAHGEDCFLCMGGTVICKETGKAFSNATVAEVDTIPADIDTVGYEYHAGVFVPCAPYGVGAGELMVACEECGTPKRSKVTADAEGGLHIPGYLTGAKIADETATALGLTDATVNGALEKVVDAAFLKVKKTTLVDLEIGDTFPITETIDGVTTQRAFRLITKDYNGTGNPLVMRTTAVASTDLVDGRLILWNDGAAVPYANSTLDNFVSNTYINYLDEKTRNSIIPVDIDVLVNFTPTLGTINRRVFVLSAYEVNMANNSTLNEGAVIPYFSDAASRTLKNDGGEAQGWWTRSPFKNGAATAYAITSSGGGESVNHGFAYRGVVPAFVLPSDYPIKTESFLVDATGNNVDLVGITKIATGSYTGTGNYGSSNKITLTFNFKPKLIVIKGAVGSNTGTGIGTFGQRIDIFYGSSNTSSNGNGGTCYATATWGGNSITFYSTVDASVQLNKSGSTYNYVVFG